MIVGIHHTALSTRDADRLVRFYRELFGFEVEFDFPWDETNEAFKKSHAVHESAGRVVMIANGSSRLEIFEYQKPAPRPDIAGRANADLGIAHFAIEVSDIAQEYARLAAAGMRLQSGLVVQTPTIQMAYGRDPDGNIIELIDFDASSEP
jgi:catechol 2,3-dioxygenase-like lactoylglutathione lyase family enzyme